VTDLPDFRHIDVATVVKGERSAGELRRDRDDVTFTYSESYATSDAPPVATTLPKRSTPYVERGGAVAPFFAGLLPEGRRQSAIRTQLKTSADDEFTQLIAVGADCIGDVRVLVDESVGESRAWEPIEVPAKTSTFRDLFADLLQNRPLDDHSVPGVQDKISNSMISVPVKGRYGAAIIKLTPAGFPKIVENEAFFLGVAHAAGLAVPKFELVKDKSGETALVVQRFDRVGAGDKVRRIAQEDAIQLLNRWPSAKYRVTPREVFDAVAAATAAPLVECQKLLKLFALSYVIGNGDLHGKNVSVYQAKNLWQLTPVYDVLSTLPYGDRNMAISLEGRDDNLRSRHFVDLAGRVGLNERTVRKSLDDVLSACSAAIDRLGEIGLDTRKTDDLATTMAKRISDLKD
jgi:serine/threonine-protein kinase HipA